MNRLDFVQYDSVAVEQQKTLKSAAEALEFQIGGLGNGRAKSLAITKLEECYMWCDKAVRDDQIARNGAATLQEDRINS